MRKKTLMDGFTHEHEIKFFIYKKHKEFYFKSKTPTGTKHHFNPVGCAENKIMQDFIKISSLSSVRTYDELIPNAIEEIKTALKGFDLVEINPKYGIDMIEAKTPFRLDILHIKQCQCDMCDHERYLEAEIETLNGLGNEI